MTYNGTLCLHKITSSSSSLDKLISNNVGISNSSLISSKVVNINSPLDSLVNSLCKLDKLTNNCSPLDNSLCKVVSSTNLLNLTSMETHYQDPVDSTSMARVSLLLVEVFKVEIKSLILHQRMFLWDLREVKMGDTEYPNMEKTLAF